MSAYRALYDYRAEVTPNQMQIDTGLRIGVLLLMLEFGAVWGGSRVGVRVFGCGIGVLTGTKQRPLPTQ